MSADNTNLNWHRYFIGLAAYVSQKSKDRSTKVGAVIVGPDHEVRSVGFNGAPRGVDEVHERPLKYKVTEHAERNAIYNAARCGIWLDGCTLYLQYSPSPCSDCARGVIQSGIRTIVMPLDSPFPGKGSQWDDDLRVAREMLHQSGVNLLYLTADDTILVNI